MKKRAFILGAQGRLGAALVREWKEAASSLGLSSVVGLGRADIDLADSAAAIKNLAAYELQEGDFIINCAAMTDVDRCEKEPALAMKINATTPTLLAELAAQKGARFIHLSTDYVFDGSGDRPYRESDRPAPLSHYGSSKLAGEEGVMMASPQHLVARVSWVFGPDRASFIDQIIQRALTSHEVAAVHDKTSSPAYTKDLAAWLTIFLNKESEGGIYHLCNGGTCSWRDYGEYALQVAAGHGMPVLTTSVAPLKLSDISHFAAVRPPRTSLDTTKFSALYGKPLRSWQEAVEEYVSLGAATRHQGSVEVGS